MRERYIPTDNQWTSHPEFDTQGFSAAVEADLGVQIQMAIRPNGDVIVDFDELPSETSENAVKQAIRDNHPYR